MALLKLILVSHHNSTKKHKKDKKKKDRHTHKEKVENAVSPDSERVRKGDSITEEESYPNVTDFNPPAVSESSFNSIPKKIKKYGLLNDILDLNTRNLKNLRKWKLKTMLKKIRRIRKNTH